MGNIAYDSLNDNDGILFGPEWNDQIKNNGTSALEFYGDDSVYVKGDTISLNFIEDLSVEAYFKFPDYNYITNNTFASPFGLDPNIIHVYNDIYAVAYRSQAAKGYVRTVNISSKNGSIIKNIYNDNIEFEGTSAYWPKLCHVSDNIYIVAYANAENNPKYVFLQTLRIANNGTTGPLLGNYSFGAHQVYDPEIIKICDNLTALIYRSATDTGMIETINITNNYQTFSNDPVNGIYEFENNKCFEPDVVHVSGNIYAIAYGNKSGDGILKTVSITPEGVIHKPFINSFIFDSTNGTHDPDIKLVSNNTFVITYSDDKGRGHLATVEIKDNGTITQKVNDTLVYEDALCKFPKIISMVDDYFVVAFEGKKQDGWIVVCKIDDNGLIDDKLLSKFKFNVPWPLQGNTPDIIKISDNIYANVFNVGAHGGTAQEGFLRTFSLADALDSYISPINRGIIYKQDTWGIYVNKTHVVATIGTDVFSAPYVLDDINWNHLILTYDRSYLKLYCNENPVPVISAYCPNFNTNKPAKDIFIGKSFRGFIDNVCVVPR